MKVKAKLLWSATQQDAQGNVRLFLRTSEIKLKAAEAKKVFDKNGNLKNTNIECEIEL